MNENPTAGFERQVGTLRQIYLLGSRDNWQLSMMSPLYDFAGELNDDYDRITEYSTSNWKSVNISFNADGTIDISPTASGQTGSNAGDAPTRWRG